MGSIVAERAARKIISACSLPISLKQICDSFGIAVAFGDLEEAGAFYLKYHGKELIVVNRNHCLTRQRFSIAHELGHAVLQHGPLRFNDVAMEQSRPSWQEIQANVFAAEVLMPKLKLTCHGFLTPRQISKLCKVSMESATIRAHELGWMSDMDDLL